MASLLEQNCTIRQQNTGQLKIDITIYNTIQNIPVDRLRKQIFHKAAIENLKF